YWRRILRIWPAYYFVVLTAFFVVPRVWFMQSPESARLYENFGFKLAVHLFLMPNLSAIYQYWIYPIIAGAGQLWTIGIEEQFYAFWPWFVKKIKNPYILTVGALVVVWALTRLLHYAPSALFGPFSIWTSTANGFCWAFLRSELPIGAMFALFYLDKPRFYRLLVHPATVAVALAVLLNHFWRLVEWESSMVLFLSFAVLILRVVESPPAWLRLRFFEYLGKASYGIYMLHYFVIYPTINLLHGADLAWIYVVAVAGTMVAAVVFHEAVEKPILRHKHRIR
ncbi:MAG: acyltransferase, partial [Bacteroidia bacterium]|nr:acyltransferase [Bacteroidia bacterium]